MVTCSNTYAVTMDHKDVQHDTFIMINTIIHVYTCMYIAPVVSRRDIHMEHHKANVLGQAWLHRWKKKQAFGKLETLCCEER